MDKSRVDYSVEVFEDDQWRHRAIGHEDGFSSHTWELKTALDYTSNVHNCAKRARIIKRTIVEVNEVVWSRQ